MKYQIDNGLIVSHETTPPTCAGYIFNFTGHGAFAPGGLVKVGDTELTQTEIDRHNQLLGEAELAAIVKNGRGVMYLTEKDGKHSVATWAGTGRAVCHHVRASFRNFAGCDGRRDVWFTLAGAAWHGVNIGDNQICRVRRVKQ